MHWRRLMLSTFGLGAALLWLGLAPVLAPAVPSGAEDSNQAPAAAPGVIKAETNLVLVDVIVTDKKGNHLRDLEAKDFHVFEDDKEQAITSFSFVSSSNGNNGPAPQHYLVLFFDNSTMPPVDQMRAREAAARFIEMVASNDRLICVVDFGGELRVAHNFTADIDALKQAVKDIKFSAVQPNEPIPAPAIMAGGGMRRSPAMAALSRSAAAVQVRSDFGARSVLLALRSVAKSLRGVPGRKTLVMFSGGFALNPERQTELAATIDAANKANVAIYPLGAKGLEARPSFDDQDIMEPMPRRYSPGADLHGSPFPHWSGLLAALLWPAVPLPQEPSGPGGPGGIEPGSAPGGPTGPGGGAGPVPGSGPALGGPEPGGPPAGGPGGDFPSDRGGRTGGSDRSGGDRYGGYAPSGYETFPRSPIIPEMLGNFGINQQVLYALAIGTGGFTILNTNDFVSGLSKIGKELDEYYILGYVPPRRMHEGAYHRLRVKVDRKGVAIRSRNGYYDAKSPDLLAGKVEGKILEEKVSSPHPGDIPISLNAPHFYTSANVARVNLTLQLPSNTLNFSRQKGKLHSEVNVLGIAYREDGSVGARFSDTVKLDFNTKEELKKFLEGPFHYQNNFNVAPGKYTLKVVLSSGGEKFGKYETPLLIDAYDGKQFQLSAIAMSDKIRPASALTVRLEELLQEERTPLVFKGLELVPSPNHHFKRSETVGFYVEIYEPEPIANGFPQVGLVFNVVDKETDEQVFTSDTVSVNAFAMEGNFVIPIGLKVPLARLRAGKYKLEVRAGDSSGNTSPARTADFAID